MPSLKQVDLTKLKVGDTIHVEQRDAYCPGCMQLLLLPARVKARQRLPNGEVKVNFDVTLAAPDQCIRCGHGKPFLYVGEK